MLRDLVWRLIYENQLGLAFHLAIAFENKFPKLEPKLPSWLIRALVLSPHLRTDIGELANHLKNDFSKFSKTSNDGNRQTQQPTDLVDILRGYSTI